jgi:hypothetical protein
MSHFVAQLRLAEKAAEDIYFAKVNRELVESLHKRMQSADSANHTATVRGHWCHGRPNRRDG